MTNVTHTFATLAISPAAYQEIAEKLRVADYEQAFIPRRGQPAILDMHGIGLIPAEETVKKVYPP